MRPIPILLCLSAALIVLPSVRAGGPAEGLLRLVPEDAAATLVVEDLRDHARALRDAPLAAGVKELPAVREWLRSGKGGRLVRARADIEGALGVELARVRDDLLGDAVVLALRLGPDAAPDRAGGLLLLRFRDRALLDRLIAAADRVQGAPDRPVGRRERTYRGAGYTVRTFPGGAKPAEYYAVLGGDVFAWSNDEALIRGAIDRRGGVAGLAGAPGVGEVRAALPAGALASLLVDPRAVRRLVAAAPAGDPGQARAQEMIGRALGAVRASGLALEWAGGDGPRLHLHLALDPEAVSPSLRRWAGRDAEGVEPLWRRVPDSSPWVAAGVVDPAAVVEVLACLVPEPERPRLATLAEVLRGLLMGRDPMAEVLPYVGPGVVAYADVERAEATAWPLVVAIALGGDPGERGVAAAVDNALRTALALVALDPKHAETARVVVRDLGDARLTALSGARIPMAFGVGRGLLVLGTSAGAIEAYLSADPEADPPARLRAARAADFPGATSFVWADLERLWERADARRDALARRLGAGRRDLDQVLALMRLFRSGFATLALSADASSLHATLGLVPRPDLAAGPG